MKEVGDYFRMGTPYRRSPCSGREIYHPAVQDLSEQAARNSSQEESILQIVTPPNPSKSALDVFHPSTPITSLRPKTEPSDLKLHHGATFCFSQRNKDLHEDVHRQRVLVSAHNRGKLRGMRRARTVIGTMTTDTHSVFSGTSVGRSDSVSSHTSTTFADESDKIELIIRNSTKTTMEEDVGLERDKMPYKFPSRRGHPKPKSSHPGFQPVGSPLPYINGYHQQLLNRYPLYSPRYCMWMTNGLKVQSLKFNTSMQESKPKPNTGSLYRIRTHSGKRNNVDITDKNMNVIGVQKEVRFVNGHCPPVDERFSSEQNTQTEHSLADKRNGYG